MPKVIYPQDQFDLDLPQVESDSRSLLKVSNGTAVSRNIKCFYSSSSSWMSIQCALNLNWYGGCHFLTVLGRVSMAVGGKGSPPSTSQVTLSLREVQVGTQAGADAESTRAALLAGSLWRAHPAVMQHRGAQHSKSLRPISSTWEGYIMAWGHMYIQPQKLEANTRRLLTLIHLGWVENELQKLSWLHLHWAS